jgi:hypothetical protein
MFLKNKLLIGILLFSLSLDSYCFYTKNGIIYNSANAPVAIDGVSWSGFQDSKIVQGLSGNPFYAVGTMPSYYSKTYGMLDALVNPWDFADSGVTKATGVSFKTIRLPFQPGVLYDVSGQIDINRAQAYKLDPTKGNGIFCKTWETNGNGCVATVSPKEAFWITLQEFKKKNVLVLIDFHHKYGYGDGYRDGTVYDLKQYEADLSLMLDEIKARNLTNVIGFDVFNEPYRLYWYQSNGGQPAWTNVIASAAKIIQQKNPNLLLFVEGSGPGSGDPAQPVICVKTVDIVSNNEAYSVSPDSGNCAADSMRVEFKGNWGEDFKPLLDATNAKKNIASFNRAKFEQQLLNAGLSSTAVTWLMGDVSANNAHIVFSPHVYPREVATWESAPGKPSDLRFDWTWGFLKKAGYPIVLGEASWKSAEGLSFFEKSIVPYLKKNAMQNNLFFWAVGYLGDTISMVDPNSAQINLQAQQVLHNLFNQTINTGTLNVSFTSPGFPIKGATDINVKELNQLYSCDYQGCSVELPTGSYTLLVSPTYQIDPVSHLVYLVKAMSPTVAFKIDKGLSTAISSTLEGQQQRSQPATNVLYKVNLFSESGQAVSNATTKTNLKFTSAINPQTSVNCAVANGSCSATLFNQNLNSKTGAFSTELYTATLPSALTVNGKAYSLLSDKSDKKVTVATTSTNVTLNAFYQAKTIAPPTTQSCTVTLTMQNRWTSGAVIQGYLTNTSNKSIKNFTFKVSFNASQITSPRITSAWLGNNATLLESAGIFTLNAQTYDSYSGLAPGQQQAIGFQLSGTVLKDITINVLSCSAN